jgi:hypothetical protein
MISRRGNQHGSFAVASITGGTPYAVTPGAADPAPGASSHLAPQAGNRSAIHTEASNLSVATTDFRETLGALGITQHHVARLFGVGPRSVRRWQYGDRRVPCGVGIVLRLLAAGTVTVDQVEQAAAVAIPARTNGGAEPEPPAPLLGGPAPEPSASLLARPVPEPSVVADVKAAVSADPTIADPTIADPTIADPTIADPTIADSTIADSISADSTSADSGPTTAEKVFALAPGACRWPYGDPGHSDFHFCGDLVAQRPYCGRHRALAYVAPAARQFSRSSSSSNSRSLRQRF